MKDQPETLTLAPAAGAGIGKQVADRLLARPDFVELMVQAAVSGLQAEMPQRWDSNAKDWAPAVPDYKTRLAAWLGILAHMEGDPVKRIIHQHLGGAGRVDPLAALQESPALQEAARRMLDNAGFRTRNQKPAGAVVDAEAAPLHV